MGSQLSAARRGEGLQLVRQVTHAYYNENDPKAAAWLRELIADGLIAPGTVDDRSITDVQPGDLNGFSQHHFFAGIGGWSYALRLAGWPDDRPVWTASCPCQPFSAAGRQMGNADSRHLFPTFRRLVARCGGPTIFGEQVASNLGREWFARVRVEMATLGYAVSASDLCAAGVGAPHLRQRLYWVAYTDHERRTGIDSLLRTQGGDGRAEEIPEVAGSSEPLRLAQPERDAEPGRNSRAEGIQRGGFNGLCKEDCGDYERLGDDDEGLQGRWLSGNGRDERAPWSASVGVQGSDGKVRRLEPTIQPLADGIPSRVGLIRGAGNAIVPQIAAKFIQASEEAQSL